MNLAIKNMVCGRCIRVVQEELERAGYVVTYIELGKVVIEGSSIDKTAIANLMIDNGFELLEDEFAKTIEKIKSILIDFIYSKEIEHFEGKISELLKSKISKDYNTLSSLFSSTEGITIEKYFIEQKIERVKELLMYGELNLSEIGFELGYSSVQHLSNQFKKITGMSPSKFRQLPDIARRPLDKVR